MKKSIKVSNINKEEAVVWYLNENKVAEAINLYKGARGWEFKANGVMHYYKLKAEAVKMAKFILNK